ncbi:MAG: UDP-N-acetylmuramoyl-tripeptide--D-alanyl-D-alanine ligase [Oscillospiraceae bacterium]|nr:UDP-N-acetylmuramoyl-tripeptide--D-alanyl-D-alanine ligase [Oscillospiraceae bacterium]
MIKIIAITIYLIIIIAWSLFYFTGSMHIFQLNSYKNDIHIKWLTHNRFTKFRGLKKAKKPLVYTHRVLRMCLTSFIIYSAAVTALIILTINISNYFLLGVLLLLPLAVLLPIIANIINAPVEKINNNRYINDAKQIINSHPNLITIGITGSYGKTSTKYFLNALLSVKFNTLMTPASFNTTLGVVKTVREQLKATHEIFVCEMGAKWVGDIKEICDIVKPKHSMLTSIGPQHLETFKSMENIINTKFEITDCIKDGTVFLNFDNEFIRNRKINKNIVKYGTEANDLDYKASDISVSEKGTEFTVTVNNEATRFSIKLLGVHNVQNITGAIAVAHTLGIPMQDLIRPVKKLEPVPHRLQMINKGSDIIIDDAFNSNPVGAKAALDVLKMFGGTRFLVTPGMVELGEKEFELNKEFGAYSANCCDFAVLIGEKQAIPIKAGLLENNFPEEKIKIFKTINEGLDFINATDSENRQKIILLENDLPDNY